MEDEHKENYIVEMLKLNPTIESLMEFVEDERDVQLLLSLALEQPGKHAKEKEVPSNQTEFHDAVKRKLEIDKPTANLSSAKVRKVDNYDNTDATTKELKMLDPASKTKEDEKLKKLIAAYLMTFLAAWRNPAETRLFNHSRAFFMNLKDLSNHLVRLGTTNLKIGGWDEMSDDRALQEFVKWAELFHSEEPEIAGVGKTFLLLTLTIARLFELEKRVVMISDKEQ